MSYTVVCPYCNDAVCIPMTMCNNIFRHGVFVEKVIIIVILFINIKYHL